MIWTYQLLDITATIIEIMIFYTFVTCLLRKNESFSSRSRFYHAIPYVLIFIVIYLLTWYTDLGAYKMVVIVASLSLLVWYFYRTTFINAAIPSILGAVMIMLTESVGGVIGSFFYPAVTVEFKGMVWMHWIFYLMTGLERLGIIWGIRKLFGNFCYHFTWKDFVWILLDGAAVQAMFYFNNQPFFDGNSQYFNVILETICIIVFTALFIPILLLKNYYTLREEKNKINF